MILTVTLNPAVDRTYGIDMMILGQVNRTDSVDRFPGGKGINVARVLKQLGADVVATGFLGGYEGQFIRDSLKQMEIRCDFIEISDTTRSTVNVVAKDGYVTEILEPGPVISASELLQFRTKFEELLTNQCEMVVFSGSVPQGVPDSIYAELIQMAHEHHIKSILDTSKEALLKGITANPFMVKPNHKEMEVLVGYRLTSVMQIEDAARKIQRNGIENVVVTLGRNGIVAVNKGQIRRAMPPDIHAKNAVGSGDCVVAVYAFGYCNNRDEESIIREATAVSAANAAVLEIGHIDQELVDEYENRIEIY